MQQTGLPTHKCKEKAKVIRTAILKKAFYATETPNIPDNILAKLRTAIADVIGTKAAERCLALSFPANSEGEVLDPWIQIYAERAVSFRRMFYKHPPLQKLFKEIYSFYNEANLNGIYKSPESLNALKPAPVPGSPDAAKCKPHFNPMGPIGHLRSAA